MGSLVVLRPGAALDLLFLGEQALELRVHRDDGSFLGRGSSTVGSSAAGSAGAAGVPGSPRSGRRRPPPAEITRRGRGPWPDVSPTAMAASRLILSSPATL